MKLSRRDLPFLLPALAAAQTTARKAPLPSAAFRYEDLAARKNGTIVMRQILTGDTHSGFTLDLHETELPAGEAPHAPHHHVHEEMLLVREGLLEATIGGRASQRSGLERRGIVHREDPLRRQPRHVARIDLPQRVVGVSAVPSV